MAERTVLAVSLVLHGALAVAVWQIDANESHAATAIEIAETRKKVEAKKAAEAPAPPPPAKKLAKAGPAKAPEAAAPPPAVASLDALPDFGLELSGGTGGLAVAAADLGHTQAASTLLKSPKPVAPVVRRSVAARTAEDPCADPPAKPRPINVPQPAYSDRAREAGIEGKVRVELTVDETGRVVFVRVLQGLGHGLDEAAVAAAERATFEPALRCGKPTRATFTMGIRFSAT